MDVVISSRISISNPDPVLLNYCRKNLRIRNPEFAKKRRLGFWTGSTPEYLYLYEQDGNTIRLPYGCLSELEKGLIDPTYDTITANFNDPQMVDYQCEIPLYDYQEPAVEAMAKVYCGILQSPAGSGKTQMGIALAVKLGRKALWLTHTKDLLSQSKRRAEQYMSPLLCGTITEGRVSIGAGITFATVQTMSSLDLTQYRNVWDTIIVDECHHVAGTPTSVTQFSRVLNSLAARHKYGLSATVHRADGLIVATHALLGEIVYSVPEETVQDKIIKPKVQPVFTDTVITADCLDTDGVVIYTKLIETLVNDQRRNKLIVNTIVNRANSGGSSHIILADRIGHLEAMMSMLPPAMRKQAVMVTGSMTTKKGKAEREQAIEDMRLGRKKFLFATYSLAKEGLDIPRLDSLYLASPQRDFAVIVQSLGRISRTFEGKTDARCFDFVDYKIKTLVKFFKQRERSYRKLGCEELPT